MTSLSSEEMLTSPGATLTNVRQEARNELFSPLTWVLLSHDLETGPQIHTDDTPAR